MKDSFKSNQSSHWFEVYQMLNIIFSYLEVSASQMWTFVVFLRNDAVFWMPHTFLNEDKWWFATDLVIFTYFSIWHEDTFGYIFKVYATLDISVHSILYGGKCLLSIWSGIKHLKRYLHILYSVHDSELKVLDS